MTAVRTPVLAGTWYPAQPGPLRDQVKAFLAGAEPERIPPGDPLIALAPHAGYQYSGAVAGKLYGALSGRRFAAVFILAPCHRTALRRPALSSLDAFATPLGEVPLAADIVRALGASDAFEINDRAHAFEHAVEIQLPFLQCALPAGTPIVPILFPRLERVHRHRAARALDPWRDGRHLLLISSDLTHYGDAYGYVPFTTDVADRLERLDGGAIRKFLDRDADGLMAYAQETGITMCGVEAAAIALDDPSAGPHRAALLSYERSADLTGDENLSVSYAAAVICSAAAVGESGESSKTSESSDATVAPLSEAEKGEAAPIGHLTAHERRYLVRLAREAVTAAVRGNRSVDPIALAAGMGLEFSHSLEEKRGAFVTLTLDGRLRGCIGTLEARKTLAVAVADSAASAALDDPRFDPVTPAELEQLKLEVSALTPLQPVDSPDDIDIGRHGILLCKEDRQAVFLPQVPAEQGWDLATTLDHLALKAGMKTGAWRRDCSFKVFEAEICHE